MSQRSKPRSKPAVQVTLKDVARMVGVHPSTASRVLNPATRDMVSPDVTARVLATVEALGYMPNPFALGLRTRRSRAIGIVVPDLTNPVFPPMVRGIENVLDEAGFTAILADAHLGAQERQILDRMRSRWVDGLILATATRGHKLAIGDGELPVVLINRVAADGAGLSVCNDDALGIRLAIDHMVELGHKNIAHIAGPQDTSTGYARAIAFVNVMNRHGLEANVVVACQSYSEEEGRTAMRKVLGELDRPTAVVCANDLLALGSYDVMRERGLKCPDDISISGFNDMPFVDRFNPPMTTVHIPMFEMGKIAAQLILEVILNPAAEVESRAVTPTLVVRGSTGPVRLKRSDTQ
jgi:LacI family transcriptional regulator